MCLSQAAFDILKAEIQRRCANNPAGQVQQEIALKRLEKLRSRRGEPFTLAQLRDTLNDLFPDFDEKVLQRAAKANCPPSPVWGRLKVGAIALASITGGIWFLNLPYPMIRYPVAKTMPIVLLPSFMSMDHNYRQAIASTEQADQLVNRATSAADFELGDTKVKAAQKNLDALPVWFLGYYPGVYCGWFGCGWNFTLDEFQQARKNVARMEARLFQERNALTTVAKAEQTIATAKIDYEEQTGAAEKQTALDQWRQAMDELKTVSRDTLGGRTAETKLQAFERDFQQVAGFTASNTRSSDIIQSAKLAAETAQKFSSKPAQTVAEWQEAVKAWEAAITQLNIIKQGDADYLSAQKLLQTYNQSLINARIRLKQEQDSVQAYEQAEQMIQTLVASVSSNAEVMTNVQVARLQAIVAELKKVQPNTTVYANAQTMLKNAQSRLR